MSKLNFIIAAVAAVALVIAFKVWHQASPPPSSPGGLNAYVLAPPKPIDKFSLLDFNGKTFNHNALWAHWTFVVFGSATHQTHEVSESLHELNKMVDVLSAKKQTPVPQVVFVSIDPVHDSLDVLKKYVTTFNPNFIGVTGDSSQINVLYQLLPPEKKSALLLLDPSGKLTGIFPVPHHSDAMVKDFKIIVQNAG